MGPSQFQSSRDSTSEEAIGEVRDSWATRNGFNLESFKKKESGADIELERPMKTRHLHMISIGKRSKAQYNIVRVVELIFGTTQAVQLAPASSSAPAVLWRKVAPPVYSSTLPSLAS